MALIPFTQRVFAVRQQAAQGTWLAPDFASHALLLLNGATNVEGDEFEEQTDSGVFGEFPSKVGNLRGYIEGDLRLVGHATAGTVPPWDAVMRNAGHTQSGDTDHVIYTPINQATNWLSAIGNHADRDYHYLDCRTQLQSIRFEIGSAPLMRVSTKGTLRQNPTDVSTPAATISAFVSPLMVETSTLVVTVGGTEIEVFTATLDFNHQIATVPHSVRQETAASSRRPRLKLKVNRQALSVKNWYSIARASTQEEVVITLVDATATAKQVRLTVPNAQVMLPRAADQSGFASDELEFRCINTGAGEYALRLGVMPA